MKERLLRIEAPHFVAGCVWVKQQDGTWKVARNRCAPIIKWMTQRAPEYVSGIINAKGWRHEWFP